MPARKKSTAGRTSKKKAAKKKTAAKTKAAVKKSAAKSGKTKRKAVTKKPATRVTKKKPAAAKKTARTVRKTPVAKKATAAKKAPAAKKRPAAKKTARRSSAPRRSALYGPLHGFQPYDRDRGEEYMSEHQLVHFQHILEAWRKELMEEVDRTMDHMKDEAANFPDPNDRATQESEFGLELRTRDRERKLIRKINSALQRIDERSYGFCDETGEEIGLKRLEARPVATLTLEAQERREMAERQYRDRDDRYR